ncbi:peptidase MA family metallohydrolase [Gordonia humi]|uniref:peptidase MA family metallohydrolase n=1 Tax=Gordonia humi TaxID=686429 RepID=UPI00361B83A7
MTLGPLAACSGASDDAAAPSGSVSTTPLNPFEQQRTDGVGALLDELSAVVRSGDASGLDDLIDPAAPAAFREQMTTMVSAFAARGDRGDRGGPLRVASLSYRVAPTVGAEWQMDPRVVAEVEARGSSDTWVTPVELTYALGGAAAPGLDEPPVTLNSMMSFARYDDDWKLVGDADIALDPRAVEDVPRGPVETGPWAFPGVAAADVKTAGGLSTVLSYPGTDTTVSRARRLLPGAVEAVDEFWGSDWPRRAAVVATGDDAEFAGLTRTATSETTTAAAATVYSSIDRRAKQVLGQRIVLSPNARDLSEPALSVILKHELLHVATRLTTAENAPMWLTEGVPEYLGRKGTYREFVDAAPDLAVEVAAGRVPKTLPADSAFAVDSDAARVAYQSAWSFAAFVADEYGEPKLKDLYRKVSAGGDTDTVDAAVKSAVGADKKVLVEQWQKWLRAQVRG